MSRTILDEGIKIIAPNNLSGYLISLFLMGSGLWSWHLLWEAGYLKYDANYSNIVIAVIISTLTLLLLAIVYWWNRKLFYQNIIVIILWFLASSPPTLIYVCIRYEMIFGSILKHAAGM